MKTLVFVATAVAMAAIPGIADARPAQGPIARSHVVVTGPVQRHWGGHREGRWIGGWGAPGGWRAYRRPHVGFVLPRYWIAPRFHVVNYGYYGFATPHPGTGWSRYYDDAVMIDGRGHVYDRVENVDWDRYDGYDDDWADDSYPRDEWEDEYRRGDDARTIGAGVVGGAVGRMRGHRLARRRHRPAGPLIGAGVGALAGLAAGSAKERRNHPDYEPYPYADYEPGDYDNPYERISPDEREDVLIDRRHALPPPPPRLHYAPVAPHAGVSYNYAPGVTTIVIQPAVTTTTTTTTFVEEVAHTPKPRYRVAPVKRWRPKSCKC